MRMKLKNFCNKWQPVTISQNEIRFEISSRQLQLQNMMNTMNLDILEPGLLQSPSFGTNLLRNTTYCTWSSSVLTMHTQSSAFGERERRSPRLNRDSVSLDHCGVRCVNIGPIFLLNCKHPFPHQDTRETLEKLS